MYTGHEIGFTNLIYPTAPGPLEGYVTGLCKFLADLNTTVTGKVVFCLTEATDDDTSLDNAIIYSIEKGADGLIIARTTNNQPIDDGHDDRFPIIYVDFELGMRILQYIRYSKSPMVKLSPPKTLVGKFISTKLAAFSSRGPSSNSPAILKPDIAAPGVNILAATSPLMDDQPVDKGFAFMTGTSMAAPHISGIVALLKSVHPSWSPAAIKSAMVTTGSTSDDSGGPIFAEGSPRKLADPFDFGGGIVNPNKAAQPGLVYDMGITDYIHYLCAMGYKNSDISKLVEHPTTCPSKRPSILDVNVPSITIPWLRDIVTVTRTVTNVGVINSTYRAIIEPPSGTNVVVKPEVLVFRPPMKMMSFTVTISTSHRKNTGYYFGSLIWTDGMHSVRSPISVRTQVKAFYVDYN